MWGRILCPSRQVWTVASVAATQRSGRFWVKSGTWCEHRKSVANDRNDISARSFAVVVLAKSAQTAMLMATAAIDADAFSKHPETGDDEVG